MGRPRTNKYQIEKIKTSKEEGKFDEFMYYDD